MSIEINFNGASISKPGAYSRTNVNLAGGFPLSPAGVVGIVGEAAAGAPGTVDDIRVNAYTSDQLSDIIAKYKSGPIVDSARILFNPSADNRIANGANQIFIYKTNASTAATGTLATAYGTVTSLNYGKSENLINFSVAAAAAEALYTTTFNWMPDSTSASSIKARVNGGALQTLSVSADDTPSTVKTTLDGATGLAATGATNRLVIAAGQVAAGTIALASTLNVVTITIAANTWNALPTAGDTMHIPLGSAIVGAANANAGGYLVTAATTNTITAVKLGDPSVACAAVGAVDIASTTADMVCWSPITLTQDAATSTGTAAALQLLDGGGAVASEEEVYGGTDRGMLSAAKVSDASTLGVVVSGTTGVFTISSSWAGTAVAGDILWVRPGSVVAHTLANIGAWRVTAATATTITATKLSNGGTATTVSPADIAATTDLVVFKGIFTSSVAGIVNVSSQEAEVTVEINRQSDNLTEDSVTLGGNVALMIGYAGTTATLTISSTQLTTSVVGGSGPNQSITLTDYATLNDLATFLNSQTDYTCSVGSALYGQLAPSALDRVTAVGICTDEAGDKPGRLKKDSSEIQAFFDASSLVSLTRTAFAGLPVATTTRVFLSGGAIGGSTAAGVQAGIDAMQKVRINSLVPLFSQDATTDILSSLTETSSTYQIAAINAAAKSHCLLMSNTKNRSERNAYVSLKDTFVNSETAANNLASARVSFAIQDVKVLKTDGTLAWVNPWGMASYAAGMQAGAPNGEPMTFKAINVSGIRHSDFDPATETTQAIQNGILFAENKPGGGFRIDLGNTTYGADANFVYNRISVLYAADLFAYNLRQQLEAIYVGVSDAVASATAIKNTVAAFCGTALVGGLIVGDDTNGGLGYKNLIVTLVGSTVNIAITITPTQGVDFILATITLDNVTQTA